VTGQDTASILLEVAAKLRGLAADPPTMIVSRLQHMAADLEEQAAGRGGFAGHPPAGPVDTGAPTGPIPVVTPTAGGGLVWRRWRRHKKAGR